MKKTTIIIALFASGLIAACGGIQREPSDAYMPDMAYSRAYETYADHSILTDSGIFYNSMPVAGTVARGQEWVFHLPKDVPGDTTNYIASRAITNPIDSLSPAQMTEAERLYLIQCAVCHATDLKGGGPLFASGKFTSRPIGLVGDAKYEAMPDGQMFNSITYGRNMMGPYGPQLSTQQRWMIVKYIRQQQAKAKSSATPAAGAAVAGKDMTGAAQK